MGNTTRGVVPLSIPWDHPHVYGEYEEETLHLHSFLGSPPRIWGIPMSCHIDLAALGDHPHVYGEYRPKMEIS